MGLRTLPCILVVFMSLHILAYSGHKSLLGRLLADVVENKPLLEVVLLDGTSKPRSLSKRSSCWSCGISSRNAVVGPTKETANVTTKEAETTSAKLTTENPPTAQSYTVTNKTYTTTTEKAIIQKHKKRKKLPFIPSIKSVERRQQRWRFLTVLMDKLKKAIKF